MKLVSKNTQADIDRERATVDLSLALRELTANLIRITRGAGRAHLIPDQIAEVIHELVAYHDAAGTLQPEAIIEMLQFGQDPPFDGVSEEGLDRLAAEELIVRGALQIAASRLVGQSTQRANGSNEMYDGVREVERLRAKAAAGRIASQSKPVVGGKETAKRSSASPSRPKAKEP